MAQQAKTCAEYSVRLAAWVSIGLLSAVSVFGQRYPILPVPNSPHGIFAMMQDSQSAIWVGTKDDAFRFDGRNFYSLRQYGFPREMPRSFAEDGDGGIWIGAQTVNEQNGAVSGGVYRYQHGKVERILSDPAVSVVNAGSETMLATIASSNPWDFGDLYIFRKGQNGWQATKILEKDARYLTVDHQGNTLFPCHAGVCEFSPAQILSWPRSGLRPALINPTRARSNRVLRDRFGCLWARNELYLTYECPKSKGVNFSDSTIGPDDHYSLSEMEDGSILGLGLGLVLGRPGAMHVARAINGLPDGVNVAIAIKDGTILLGTNSGLYRFMYPFRLEYWNQQDGVESPFFILHSGNRVYSSNSGIQVLDRTRTRWDPWVDRTEVGTAVHLIPGPDQSIYVASLIRGVTQIAKDGKVLARSTSRRGGARLATDAHGHMWLAGDDVTLVTSKGNRLELTPQGMAGGESLDMEFDAKRSGIWACHGRSVEVIEGDHWKQITHKDGLLDDDCRSIAVLPNGDVWVGYANLGSLSRIWQNRSGVTKIDTYSPNTEPHDGDYTFLDSDSRGWLWWATGNKDYVATPGAAEQNDWISLDAQDGIPDPGGNQNSFSSDTDGSIWFAHENTVVHFAPPEDFATHFPPPPVFVAGFTQAQGGAILADAIGSILRNSDVVVHIGSLQFDRRNALHFRYRLLPEQAAWTSTHNFDITLGKPRWGHHTLQVQAQLATGPWSPVVEQTLTVSKPIWLDWPALGGYLMAVGTLMFAGRKWRRKRRERLKKLFPDLAEWRLAALSPELQQLNGELLDGRFEVGRVLARGGFAIVAEGRDLQEDSRRCAIKIFRQDLGDSGWTARRFRQEVRVLEQIRHPNIVRIYGSGALPLGALYLVMEFVEGCTLRELLDTGTLRPENIGSYLLQIGEALEHIHRLNICHRDLKPENLMIRGNELILIDFSIAIIKDPEKTVHGLSRAAGTICYMAPEQVIGYADPATDIYSLAKVTIEMITGKRISDLFPDASMDLPDRVRSKLGDLQPRLSTESLELLASALEFDPKNRPNRAHAFAMQIAKDLGTTV